MKRNVVQFQFNIKNIVTEYFGVLNFLCLIACFVDIKLGVLASLLIFFLWLIDAEYNILLGDIPFALYMFANIASLMAYLWNNRPIEIFLSAVSFNVLPALLYCVGKKYINRIYSQSIMLKILHAIIFMMVVGTITYLVFPSFYYEYIGQSIDSYKYGLSDYRYGSFISSLALGSVSVVAVLLYFREYENLKKWQVVTYLPLILSNALLCMQRSAWLLGVIALFMGIILRFSLRRKQIIRLFFAFAIMIGAILLVWNFRSMFLTETQLQYIERRLTSFSLNDMITSRNSQWLEAFEVFMQNPILGFGLGSCGQKAAPYGLAIVTDGNHLRVLAELGLMGFVPFIVLNLSAIYKSVKYKEYYLGVILLLCNMAAIGSPIFDQFYGSFIYWIVLGAARGLKLKQV